MNAAIARVTAEVHGINDELRALLESLKRAHKNLPQPSLGSPTPRPKGTAPTQINPWLLWQILNNVWTEGGGAASSSNAGANPKCPPGFHFDFSSNTCVPD